MKTVDIGIDLGTTNSAIARAAGEDVTVFKNRDRMDVTPSVVRIDQSGRIIVGRRAYDSRIVCPGDVALEFKRTMGQSDRIPFESTGRELTAEELSAEVLKSLLEDAARGGGEPATAAVVTVPAAFGQLQCEATARAAKRAGLKQTVLLQEPIAAAIAYGIRPEGQDCRFLIYDLGGGTFDLALMSTHGGQISVIEHRGDSMLGGKDVDQLIVDRILLPAIAAKFNLPPGEPSRQLRQALYRAAEEAKIELSQAETFLAVVLDAGNDADGDAIELELEISRAALETLVTPLLQRTVDLCRTALTDAGVEPKELSCMLLVGGPTQMPVVRRLLAGAFPGVTIDTSLDPMTVVARGAALYASTLVREGDEAETPAAPDAVALQIACEPVWNEPTCPLYGRVDQMPDGATALEVRVEAAGGQWSSGWVPVADGTFELELHLVGQGVTRFEISLRNEEGRSYPASPASVQVRRGLAVANPPLPHSIGAEVVDEQGVASVDILFPRSTSLPASVRKTYHARHTLRPSEPDRSLAIKIWEGEYPDPEANQWVGGLMIHASEIERPIPEGADIELELRIDASRCMTVEAYVPILDQHFTERVYVPEENEEAALDDAEEVRDVVDEQIDRLRTVEYQARLVGDDLTRMELRHLERGLEDIHIESANAPRDPDSARRLVQKAKELRGKLSLVEQRLRRGSGLSLAIREYERVLGDTRRVVAEYAKASEAQEFEILEREGNAAREHGDMNGMKDAIRDLKRLYVRIAAQHDWYWTEWMESIIALPDTHLLPPEARQQLEHGRLALQRGNIADVKAAVRYLWRYVSGGGGGAMGSESGIRH